MRFKVRLTYEVEVEAKYMSQALSEAQGRIERPISSFDTGDRPIIVSGSAQVVPPDDDQGDGEDARNLGHSIAANPPR